MALGLGATTLVAGQQILGRWQGFGGQHFDRMVDLSLVTFLSIGLIWAPMWSMRTARTLWRGMERPTQRDVARQILLQGLFGAPAIWIASSWATRDVSGGCCWRARCRQRLDQPRRGHHAVAADATAPGQDAAEALTTPTARRRHPQTFESSRGARALPEGAV